jgi:uncharacterized protein YdeI (YjbR/CyaY-like superfamily)
MASFKRHCVFGFWKASIMKDDLHIFKDSAEAMGGLGQIKSFDDLPSDEVLIEYIQQAIKLNEEGVKLPSKPKAIEKKEIATPQYFLDALQEDPSALSTFQNFSYSNKKEYIEWLEEAKTAATKQKRLETAIEWLADGKTRMWKYKR